MEAAFVDASVWIAILSFNRISACIEIKVYSLGSAQFQEEMTSFFHE